ncbi:MAG: NAD(P)/FAD-dependent oxidoreductase [Solirubrobacterales bacterium]
MTSASSDGHQSDSPVLSLNGSADLRGGDRHSHIAIVGTGFSGIGAAIRFRKQGRDDFVVFEKANDVGGTWRDNTYPGIACDVPSNLYSFSFALNPSWSRSYSPGAEIWNYLRKTAKKAGILPFIRFNTEVTEARWNDDAQIWHLQTSRGEHTADIVIGALGPLSEPQIPALPGIENFKGKMFHSAQWDHDYDLDGKRVAVVGTGASAIQFVPQIAKRVKQLHLYQRTAPWVMPRSERKITKLEHVLFRLFPPAQKAVRGGVYAMLEIRVVGFIKYPRTMKLVEQIARTHLKRQVPERELREQVTPDYSIGCKRVLLANNYYPALRKPNVEVITHGVTEVREGSIVGDDGVEREVDAIIWGTGFHVTRNPAWDHIIGREGHSLNEAWKDGMEAYVGSSVAGFPNLFLIVGPNTGLGHSSMVYMIESNIDYIERVVEFIDKTGAASVDVKQQTMHDYSRQIQDEASKDTIWTTGGCASWYLDHRGRNTTLWPDFTFRFRRVCREFDPLTLNVRDRSGGAMLPQAAPAQAAQARQSAPATA